jgi:hypothetical protein
MKPEPQPCVLERAADVVADAAAAVVEAVSLTGKAKAMAFLREQLANGPLPMLEVERRALAAGVTKSALRKGRNALKIKPRFTGYCWMWELPGGGR